MRERSRLGRAALAVVTLSTALGCAVFAQVPPVSLDEPLPRGSKVFLAPAEGGFENYLAAGILQKKVPVIIVAARENADFEISVVAETERAGWAKTLVVGDTTTEQAAITVTNIRSGRVVFAYAVHKWSSVKGKQSAAESCAKHLKKKVER